VENTCRTMIWLEWLPNNVRLFAVRGLKGIPIVYLDSTFPWKPIKSVNLPPISYLFWIATLSIRSPLKSSVDSIKSERWVHWVTLPYIIARNLILSRINPFCLTSQAIIWVQHSKIFVKVRFMRTLYTLEWKSRTVSRFLSGHIHAY